MNTQKPQPQVPATTPRTAVVEHIPLTQRSQQAVEAGLTEYQRVRDELEHLHDSLRHSENTRLLHEAELTLRDREIVELRAQVRELQAENNELKVSRETMRTVMLAIKANVLAFCETAEPEKPETAAGRDDLAQAAE